MSRTNATPAYLLWSMSLEEIVNDRTVETLVSDDPVLAGMGGACVVIYQDPMPERVQRFLEKAEENKDKTLPTNNPSLIKEVEEISKLQSGIHLALFSSKLKAMLSPQEFEAVVQHEYGHVFHRHLEQKSTGTYGEFIGRELEADAHSLKTVSPEVLMSGLEKCMKFGTEQAALWSTGTSGNFLRKLIDSDIIDAVTIKSTLMLARMTHKRRFTTLQQLIKEKNKA